jgi:hypothetical protein
MSDNISLTMNVHVSGGPKMTTTRTITVEAYDSIKVTILGTDSGSADADKQVEVQPGGSGQVSFLSITSDRYDAGLTYKVNSSGNPAIALDQPHVLIGKGAVGLLDPAPAELFFSSSIAADAEVQILVGRDATP